MQSAMKRFELWRWLPWKCRWVGAPWFHSRDGSYIGTVWRKDRRER